MQREILHISAISSTIEVDDPQDLLDANEDRASGVHLSVGTYSNRGIFCPASVSVRGAKKRTYSILVPYDRQTKIEVKGRGLIVEDESGVRVPADAAVREILETAEGGQAAKRMKFTIKSLE